MFLQADLVVKAVMVILLLASVLTWTVMLAKSRELARVRRALVDAGKDAGQSQRLLDLADTPSMPHGIARDLFDAARHELQLSAGIESHAGIRERVQSRLERLELAHVRELRTGMGVLATIGATAPFIGLFGTVWGIMNSFVGIAESGTTNLAVVAPGIAEALLATALGLVAAIPAVIVYNHFARVLASVRGAMGDLSAALQQLVSRDLDRAAQDR
ncbi:tonB-system energizer ExbB [Luteimonas sp. SJ-16]|uniref:Biopolymer transport protein ExbB n=2 Tax=Luteimonas deserti TaxID=2752306 RepID=A0A7Z0TXA0_9GAMM|nr:tonB-system energizer ExbB [Luteimonas deserti]